MDKSPDAFRTISEVADHLETPAHVLRFWESRFPQIRPVKRAGGRRYYRPADVALLTGIKRLLHDEGLTIRGVQKILREQGVRHVAGLSGVVLPDDVEHDAEAALEAAMAANFGGIAENAVEPERAVSATIVALETALRRSETAEDKPHPSTEKPGKSAQDAVMGDLFSDAALTPAPQQPENADDAFAPPAAPRAAEWFAKGDLAAALRALPRGAFNSQSDQARAIHARLVALHSHLSSPPSFADR